MSFSYPVVGEVFINDLSHLSLLVIQNVWSKVENHVEHARLCCQRCAAVLWGWVGCDLHVIGEEGGMDACEEGGQVGEGGR